MLGKQCNVKSLVVLFVGVLCVSAAARDGAGNSTSRPDGAETSRKTVKLSLEDCLAAAVAHSPDLAVTDLSAGKPAAPDQTRFAARLERPAKDGVVPPAIRAADLRESVCAVLYDARKAYWDLVLAREKCKAYRELREQAKARADSVQTRIKIDATVVDMAFAQAYLTTKELGLSAAEQSLRAAEDRLKLVLNDPKFEMSSDVEIIPTTAPSTPAAGAYTPADLSGRIQAALKRKGPVVEGNPHKADRLKMARIEMEVKDAHRKLLGAIARVDGELKAQSEWETCCKALKDVDQMRGRLDITELNVEAFTMDQLAAARVRVAEAHVACEMAKVALGRVCGDLCEQPPLKVKLAE